VLAATQSYFVWRAGIDKYWYRVAKFVLFISVATRPGAA
jgi:hypothetical protein